MAKFAAAQTAFLTELEQHIERITPDIDSRTPFQRYKGKAADLSALQKSLIGARQFAIAPGRQVGVHGVGYGYSFPLYEYDVLFQYPKSERWAEIMHSDAVLIKYKLLNTKTSVSGVQLRQPKPEQNIETIASEEFQSMVITVLVHYEVNDTA